MSIVVTTDIFCDGTGCGNWVHGTVSDRIQTSVARRVASSEGWRFVSMNGRYVDLCPSCLSTYRIPDPRRR